jgi:hypothetical protein
LTGFVVRELRFQTDGQPFIEGFDYCVPRFPGRSLAEHEVMGRSQIIAVEHRKQLWLYSDKFRADMCRHVSGCAGDPSDVVTIGCNAYPGSLAS